MKNVPPIETAIPREVGMKLRRLGGAKKGLTIASGVGNLSFEISATFMPNQHSIDKINVSAWVNRTLAQRLRKKARQRGEKLTELLEWLYVQATRNIELSPEDYRQIAEETERARKRLGAKGNTRKAPAPGKTRGKKS